MDARSQSINITPWVAGRPEGYYFVGNPIVINATPEVVWGLITDISRYEAFSNGIVKATIVEDELKVGNTIQFELYKDQAAGAFFPISNETISVADHDKFTIAWERATFGKGRTESYRVLEPINEGTQTRLHSALKIPGFLGFFVHAFMKSKIENAFNSVADGIKQTAELKK